MIRLLDTTSRRAKAAFLLALDSFLTLPALFVALQLRLGEIWPVEWLRSGWPLFVLLPFVAAMAAWALRIPMVVLRAFENRAILKIGVLATILTVFAIVVNAIIDLAVPRSVPGIFGLLFVVFAVLVRLGLLALLDWVIAWSGVRPNVIIYGAGAAGQQLLGALRGSIEARPIAFVDDNAALHRLQVGGLQVFSPRDLPGLTARRNVRQVLLAMPSIGPQRRREILNNLRDLNCEVLALPGFVELLDGRSISEQLQPVAPVDLLERTAIALDMDETVSAYRDKVVLVTGAGGSIGSELCRQLLAMRPRHLVLFEANEFALYNIEMDLRQLLGNAHVEITPVLGSVADARRVEWVMQTCKPAIVLHAAAHKHVPLVEQNEIEGASNNILGTMTVAKAAGKHGVRRFILISTDKAVRPASVMGATKRAAEIVLQTLQAENQGTVYSMVRFGNVLGSSGSVIPLFQKQIAQGGPITLTHLDVTRYFMTIPEAVQLVLVAGSFARGGEVFVLDMGKPVRIYDLARRLVELSGLTLRDRQNPDGDIEIRTTGLRPGEKLFEELLIGANVIETPHPKIMRAMEDAPKPEYFRDWLARLQVAIEAGDATGLRSLLWELAGGAPVVNRSGPGTPLPDPAKSPPGIAKFG